MRREYYKKTGYRIVHSGLPLHAQGIPSLILYERDRIGITPACAGNTFSKKHMCIIMWDYPCMRREY